VNYLSKLGGVAFLRSPHRQIFQFLALVVAYFSFLFLQASLLAFSVSVVCYVNKL
jgi:hypothetical protein